jgi:hypothetical protein
MVETIIKKLLKVSATLLHFTLFNFPEICFGINHYKNLVKPKTKYQESDSESFLFIASISLTTDCSKTDEFWGR